MPTQQQIDLAARAARIRLQNAASKGEQISAGVAAWNDTKPFVLDRLIADDRLSWRLTITKYETPQEADLDQWGLWFGEGVHSARAALDNLLYSIARQEGASAEDLKRIQFPVVTKPEEWAGTVKRYRLDVLGPAAVEALRRVQPFNRAPGEVDGLVMLHALDIGDKHRYVVEPGFATHEMEHNFSIEFEDGGMTEAGPPRVTVSDRLMVGEDVWFHDTSPDRIKEVTGSYSQKIAMLIEHEGEKFPPLGVLSQLIQYADRVASVVLSTWVSGNPDAAGVPPGSVPSA
jgi:hypothetical protein